MNNTDLSTQENKAKQNEDGEKIELYLSDLWKGFLKFWWLCAGLAVICAVAMFIRSYISFTPSYRVSATFTVQTQDISAAGNGISSYSFYYNRSTADQLSDTFPYILESNLLQTTICEDLGVETMPASISATSVEGTNMFTMTAVGRDARQTYDVLISAIDNYPTVAEYVIGSSKLTMISEPVFPEEPYNNSPYFRHMFFGFAFGVLLGIAWIILYAVFRNTIRTKLDIREKLNQHCLGVLPKVSFKKHNREIDRSILMTNHLVGDTFLESVRLLRNAVIKESGENTKVIMVTSSAPDEGKTTVAANLAVSLAKVGKKVILVDCDMRNPSVKNLIRNHVNNAMNGDDADTNLDSVKDINVMTFNVNAANSWKLMQTAYLKDRFDALREEYDFVIVDSPPCALTSDPVTIAGACDAAVLVIRQDSVRTTRIKYALESLLSVDIKMLGCVLNVASSGLSGYGYYYGGYGYKYSRYGYSKYGYGKYGRYGYGYGKDKKHSASDNE